MENYTGVVERRLAVRGRVTVSGIAKAGADVLSGGRLEVHGIIGQVTVAAGGYFHLSGVMSSDLVVAPDAQARISGIFQGRVDAPEGVEVSEGALVRVGSTVCQVAAGKLQPAPANIETLTVSSSGPWYRWHGSWKLERY